MVRASDGSNDVQTDVTIRITDVDEGTANQPPTFDNASYSFSQSENTPANTLIGVVSATDPEGNTPIYTLTNAVGSRFAINASGELTNAVEIDYESLLDAEKADGITVTVRASDGSNDVQTDVTIRITDVDEGTANQPPTFDNASYSFSQSENTPANTLIGVVSATDPEGNTPIYALTNAVGSRFAINASGELTNAVEIDYESLLDAEKADGITVTVRASDGSNDVQTDVTIRITDVDEAPTFDELSYSFTQEENTSANTLIGVVSATDPEGNTPIYALTNDVGSRFAINASGELTNAVEIDYESLLDAEKADGITVTVHASDGSNDVQTDVTIRITDVVDESLAITNISPLFGEVGASVEITGVGFSSSTSDNVVTFLGEDGAEDDQKAEVSSATTTQLVVLVPEGAVSGPIQLELSGEVVVFSQIFQVLPTAMPVVVSSFMPERGEPGIEVTILGENFSDMASENKVTFGSGATTEPSVATSTSLTVTVPQDAVTGRISVTVGDLIGVSTAIFEVPDTQPSPTPVVSSFTPTEAAPGAVVSISGENFSLVLEANTVVFGGSVAVTPFSATTTVLIVHVPLRASTGRISVITNGQIGTSSEEFTVLKGGTPVFSITNINPPYGLIGAEIRISGFGFSTIPEENKVIFNGNPSISGDNVEAVSTKATTFYLIVEVPKGAQDGKISVKIGDKIAVSGQIFDVLPPFFNVPSSSEEGVRVYPNPTSGWIRVGGLLASDKYVCKVYSLVGLELLSAVVRNGDAVDTSALPEGQYILVLQAEGREIMRTRLLVLR